MSNLPRATYRLQLTGAFGFAAAAGRVPYLQQLGISHLYVSPISMARAGSMHGYDVVDHTRLNPELGGEGGFEILSAALRSAGMGLIVDFVPNHMAASPQNPWWMDMLRHGRGAAGAAFFDIDWRREEGYQYPVINLPILGSELEEALQKGEITADAAGLHYFDQVFPLSHDGQLFVAAQGMDGAKAGPALLRELLRRQHYRLMHWRQAAAEINYRRFFDINELVGLRIEEEAVFDAVHGLLLDLVEQGKVRGVRLDHIDGLSDPHAYCGRLYQALKSRGAGEPYVIVEKILEADEGLPDFPGVQGTTGYEVLNFYTDRFIDPGQLRKLRHFSGTTLGIRPALAETKALVIDHLFSGEFRQLGDRLCAALRCKAEDAGLRDELHRALKAFVIHLPVYRTYLTPRGFSEADRQRIDRAIRAASAAEPALAAALALLHGAILGQEGERALAMAFTARLQQFTGPIMAKAMEDTFFYRDTGLLALNEVGGDPRRDPMPASEFHRRMIERQKSHPFALSATATHDTKRGEDARLRIASLADLADDWLPVAKAWMAESPGRAALEPAHDYTFLQSLLGAWPLEGVSDEFLRRLEGYAVKAMRESKLRTSWLDPDIDYESAALSHLRGRLAEREFVQAFGNLAGRAALLGALYGLGQQVLKMLSPGVPDIYQGTEFWDLSFVDPDNRRAVDWAAREKLVPDMAEPRWGKLLATWQDGRIKLALLHSVLRLRAEEPDLLGRGEYAALAGGPPEGAAYLAFERRLGRRSLVVVICTRLGAITDQGRALPDYSRLQGALDLPEGSYQDYLQPSRPSLGGSIPLAALFPPLPVAVLLRR